LTSILPSPREILRRFKNFISKARKPLIYRCLHGKSGVFMSGLSCCPKVGYLEKLPKIVESSFSFNGSSE
jgi:hypothetical protein